ncbi:hypothetical protein V6N12_032836 [Hibiscus sabdariffa]|uniref:Reverse transcriptase zinc-binding domain-containing protein n=1 Tax=Hibiscus sabdariffa TaxID=183260 RepID=A0ABR2AHN5_9ROSI
MKVMQRIKVFMWLAFHDRLLTNAERSMRHLEDSNMCSLCSLPDIMVWKHPPMGWVEVNCDGVRRSSDGMASAGGIVRDDYGKWLIGFVRSIGRCSVLCA